VEARLYAEDPARGFQPSGGLVTHVVFPEDVRIETWIEPGTEVTPYYDPLVAKVIARGRDRQEAITRLATALDACRIDGIVTNRAYLAAVLASEDFRAGRVHTGLLDGLTDGVAPALEVVEPGTQTTIQDWPGRLGYWDVGVPPSGPMDAFSFRLANRLVGNPSDAAGLECTVTGPTLRFRTPALVALTGADMAATVDGQPAPRFSAFPVPAGAVLRLGAVCGPGSRAYLAVAGGFDVPPTLGSRATFTLGLLGGHAGRALRAGDVVPLVATAGEAHTLPEALIPPLTSSWEIAVLPGPQGAPDFFTEGDIEAFFAAAWKVHYNSSRTGVRLVGPKPQWARQDGGEAGLHPSNIHDNAYAVGTVDFTGDMPVILGPDGPSLGGFVCPVTIVRAELWKMGQLKAGDTVRFRPVSLEEARALHRAQEAAIAGRPPEAESPSSAPASPILHALPARGDRPSLAIRQDGDGALLVEYGPMVLDLALRFRVQALMDWLRHHPLPGILDLTPGIRSLHVHFDDAVLPRERLLEELARAEEDLPATDDIEVPSRLVHLPLSWDDPATKLAIQKYIQSVRPDAPWCPSNIEFIRRINGLDTVEEVREIVLAASYLVLGLGDVYLGAPVATPIDPRHRLVTTKYNPARTWTPENAVGIGGAYLCVYGMEGPGGYQFVGRTCQMWSRSLAWAAPGEARARGSFAEGKPWLLRFFDQIRFHLVGEDELLRFREDFPRGRATVAIEPTTFRLAEYRAFLQANRASIDRFKGKQQAAFEAERERWAGLPPPPAEVEPVVAGNAEPALAPGERALRAEVTGNVWQVLVSDGRRVAAGERLVVLETMKMETLVVAERPGMVVRVLVRAGSLVGVGQTLLVMKEDDVAS
jgi:urea carboxylase